MNLVDVITLAKAGYKKKDIEELLAMEVPEEKEPEQETQTEEVKQVEPEPVPDSKEPEIDYKKLYEESQNKLKAAQKENVQKNISEDTQSDEDVLMDIIKNIS